ncbi:MAG: 3' terminal RNA ribose 2'-O-methyltransferase Hen1 [Bacteroidota bacterium]
MLVTISTTYQPATDLGFLLHKHPDKYQTFNLSVGKVHVFYPEASVERTTAAILLDIDPVELVRGKRKLKSSSFSLKQYVNDRPYVASSFLSVALSKAFSTAMNGKCDHKPELVKQKLPFEIGISVLPAPKGGEALIKKLFEPLGYSVKVDRHPLDPAMESWGESKYYTLRLTHTLRLQEVLSHLYVLIPALDFEKHYFVSNAEIEKLLSKGKGWLEAHPHKELITRRYLLNFRKLSRQAMERLTLEEVIEEEDTETDEKKQEVKKRKESLHQIRLKRVLQELIDAKAESVVDMGCGEGKLLRMMLKEKQFRRIAGMDVSYRELLKAKDRLYWDTMSPKMKERISLFQGSLNYRDKRLEGFDAAALVEVIEHLDEARLSALEKVVFKYAKPGKVFITTPNGEYNIMYESLSAGSFRHTDHRFEWTREEFSSWANRIAETYQYTVSIHPLGEEHEEVGAPSQMAIFTHGN